MMAILNLGSMGKMICFAVLVLHLMAPSMALVGDLVGQLTSVENSALTNIVDLLTGLTGTLVPDLVAALLPTLQQILDLVNTVLGLVQGILSALKIA
ncbi:GL24223 [Drosophila persimilis]|uniref:GL24223 n=1 Tax=Drosophila persimilis TaxID=7234 RepID=B4G4Q6_DROPE|nr:GL24223 [Drosophila persimilis]